MPLAVEEHPVGDLGHIPPELIRLLRVHIKRYGTTSGGRIFQAAWGRDHSGPCLQHRVGRRPYRCPPDGQPYLSPAVVYQRWMKSTSEVMATARAASRG
jgi:hypothetical protein